MKKFTYILMIFLGLSFVSCEKQVITPNVKSSESDVHCMRAAKFGQNVVLGDEDDANSANTGNGITDPNDKEIIDIDVLSGEITDPKDKGKDGRKNH
jgi:hypothetical protein